MQLTLRDDLILVQGFEIEIGGIDVAFDINGILGLDFLLRAGAIINLDILQLEFSPGDREGEKHR